MHNERTYPNLLRLFGELGVATQPTEMSMSITCEGCGLEYAGARGLSGLFAQPRLAGNPAYLRMLGEVKRFHAHARRLLEHADAGAGDDVDGLTLGTFLALGGYSRYFVQHFMIPVVSCVWSSRHPGLAGVPGALPVPVPRQPRDALGHRLAAVAHGHRRLPHLRRAGGQGPHRRADRAPASGRSPGTRTASS